MSPTSSITRSRSEKLDFPVSIGLQPAENFNRPLPFAQPAYVRVPGVRCTERVPSLYMGTARDWSDFDG